MIPISRLCNAIQLQKALSVATNNFVSKQSTVHQAAAEYSGFDSFQQALALTDRSEMIINSLWAEQYNWTHQKLWHIHSGHYTFCIDTSECMLFVSHLDGSGEFEYELPDVLQDYVISEQEIEYDHSMKKIVIRTLKHIDIIFQRHADDKVGFAIHHKGTVTDKTSGKNFPICSHTMNKSLILLDSATQLPRLLDEISAVCDRDINHLANTNGITGQFISDTIDTASWLFELDKGNDDYANELKPEHTQAASIGYVADLYLHDTPNDTSWVVEMRESMSTDNRLLNFFRGMASADRKQYEFKHYLKSAR